MGVPSRCPHLSAIAHTCGRLPACSCQPRAPCPVPAPLAHAAALQAALTSLRSKLLDLDKDK
jgi:hypothetical protein